MIQLAGIGALVTTCGALFFAVFKPGQAGLKALVYPLVIALFGGLMGLLLIMLLKSGDISTLGSYITDQFLFVFFGIFHVWWMYHKLIWAKRDSTSFENDSFLPEFTFTILTGALVLAAQTAAFVYFSMSGFPQMLVTAGVLFLLPFLFVKAYDFLNQIPEKDFSKKWLFTQKAINEEQWDWVNEVWIHFELREMWRPGRGNTGRMARFRIFAPRNVPLREVFRLAVREYNKKGPEIGVQDLGFERVNEGKFWWLFTLKFMWSRPHTWFPNMRYLDPWMACTANNLRPGDIVYARRMRLRKTGRQDDIYDDDEVAIGEA